MTPHSDCFLNLETADSWQQAAVNLLKDSACFIPDYRLGILYVNGDWAEEFSEIIRFLIQISGIKYWVPMLSNILGLGNQIYQNTPALGMVLLPDYGTLYRLCPFDNLDAKSGETILIHLPPQNINQLGMLKILSAHDIFTLGIVAEKWYSEPKQGVIARNNRAYRPQSLIFYPDAPIMMIENSACQPLGAGHKITSIEGNKILTLNHKPALQIMEETLQSHPHQEVFVALMREDSDSNQHAIRNLTAIDKVDNSFCLQAPPPIGATIKFAVRDLDYTVAQLEQNMLGLRGRLTGRKIRAGLYMGCASRQRWLLNHDIDEGGIIRKYLGDFPLMSSFGLATVYHDDWRAQTSNLLLILT